VAASPSTARAQSKPTTGARANASSAPRVEFIAISANDALLEQVGQALDGESAIRQVDTAEAARELIQAAPCCVVLLEIPPRGNAAALVRELQAPSDLSVIVVFAQADETAEVARAITATATFAVLPVPIEIAKTAAVLEGARDEALSRHTLLVQRKLNETAAAGTAAAEPTPAQTPLTEAAYAPVAATANSTPADATPSAFYRTRATRPHAPRDADDAEAATALSTPAGSGRKPLILGGLIALLVLGGGIAWYVSQREASPPAPGQVDAAAAPTTNAAPAGTQVSPDDSRVPSPGTGDQPLTVKSGAVDDLLDLARTAFSERRYTDPKAESALVYYHSVLAQEPDNGEAREGLARIAVVLDERLQTALKEGRYDDAALTVTQLKLAEVDPARLKDVEGRVAVAQITAALERDNADRAAALLRQAEASGVLTTEQVTRFHADLDRRQADARVQRLVDVIGTRIRDGQLVEPANDSARYHITQLRKLPGAGGAANAAQRNLENAVLDEARAAGQRKQNDDLERWLKEARKLGVTPARIAAVRREARPPAAAVSPAAVSDVSRLVALVQTRVNEGRLLEPAQDNALYHLGQLHAADVSGAQYAASARSVSSGLLERGRAAVTDRKPEVAQSFAVAARQLGVDLAEVDALDKDIAQLRTAPTGPRMVSADKVKRTRYVAPEYPRDAVLKNIEGSVKVRFTIDSAGKVVESSVVQSTPERVFDRAALTAVKRWRFEPLATDGEAAQATIETTVLFKMDDDAAR